MRKASSLRVRVLLLAALSIATALTVAGFSLSVIFNRHLEQRLEQELDIRLVELAAAFSAEENGEPVLGRPLSDPRYQYPYSGAYWQVSDEKGAALLRSRSLWDDDMPSVPVYNGRDVKAIERVGPGDSTLYVLERHVQVPLQAGASRGFLLSVAMDHAEIEGLRRSFAFDMAVALVILGVLLLVGAWLQAGIGLRPLGELRDKLNRVHGGREPRLSGPFPDEVEPLANDLNALLDRQQELVAKARDRAGDLAHGLKTPLTILSGEARRIDEAGMGTTAATIREQVGLMRRHVERELARARTQGTPTATGLQTELTPTVERLLRLMRRMPRGDEITWTMEIPAGTRCEIDADDFGEVFGNLLDNARKFATARIAVRVLPGEKLTICVDDDGPGLTEDQARHLLGRGERGREDVEGSGLGLSIVTDVLAAYGSRLTFARSPEGGLSARFLIGGQVGPADGNAPAADAQREPDPKPPARPRKSRKPARV
jgi:signal transduction histidine kinase